MGHSYPGRTFSGFSGYSGISGYSSNSGVSGYSGTSGTSGISGVSAYSGTSGYSGVSGFSAISGFSGTSASGSQTISQTSHGFVAGDVLYRTSGSYAKAKADAAATSDAVGVVESVLSANSFVIIISGAITGLSGLTDGVTYFLSPSTAGLLTATEPVAVGHVSKPILQATGTTTGIVLIDRGIVISPSPVNAGMKNKIVNGNFNVWQREITFIGIADGTYSADRWKYEKSSEAVHELDQWTDVPTVAESGSFSKYSVILDVTTADGTIGSTQYVKLTQHVEGYTFQALAQRAMTLSFWVKSFLTGTFCVAFQNSGKDRSYVAEYTINSSNTWEKKTINILASPSAGTWNYENGVGLTVSFVQAAGASLQTTAGAWQTGDFIATSNQVNNVGSVAHNFILSQVQLEAGSLATTFEQIPQSLELATCQRYYCKSYNQSVYAGAVSSAGSITGTAGNVVMMMNFVFPVEMRTTASCSLYNPDTGTLNEMRDDTAGANRSGGTQHAGTRHVTLFANVGIVAGNRHNAQAVAAAEL